MEKIEIAEVLNEIVKRACVFEKPKVKMSTAATTNTITTTTAYRNVKAELTAKNEAATEKEMDQVLVQPVEAAYPNLVSIFSKNEFTSNI